MKSFFLLFGLFVAGFLQDPIDEEWEAFKAQYKKKYDSDTEEELRKKVFIETKLKIDKHNQKYDEGLTTYRQGINEFSDMLDSELMALYDPSDGIEETNLDNLKLRGSVYISPANRQLPDSVDWRTKGAVTRVKHQGGDCLACWAFGAIAVIESQHFMKTGKLVSLSEQNLVDCSKQGNEGCNRGTMEKAFEYVKENGGIDTDESYPYEAEDGECRYNPENSGAKVTGYVNIPGRNDEKLTEAVANVGPVAVTMYSRYDSFTTYKDGIYFEPEDVSKKHTHTMLVVGYGTDESGGDYFIAKNSKGEDWGIEGYVKIARNKPNYPGFAIRAAYPYVE